MGLLGARGTKLVVGLATMFVYARIFGVSATYDAWVWSLGIVNAAGMILFGPITETIRASYSAIDHQEGRSAAEQYMATVAVMMIGTAIMTAAFAIAILPAVTPMLIDRQPEQSGASAFFLYALTPSLVISQLVAVLTAHLNCRGKIYSPEMAGVLGGAVGLMFIIAFPGLPATLILTGSYYMGLIAPLIVGASFWPELMRALLRLRPTIFFRHGRDALVFSLPLLLPYVLGQMSGLVERQFALQAGTGTLAVLSYAFFARNTIQAVFTAALSALAVPELARTWDPTDRRFFRAAVRHWIHQCVLVLTMGMIFLFGLSDLIPAILFGSNVQGAAELLLSELLRYYAVAIIAVILYLVGGSALLATRKGKSYALLGSIASAASTLLLIVLFPLLGVIAIPITLGISHAAAAWMMFKAVDQADTSWFVRQVVIRVFVVVAAGWVVRLVDIAADGAGVPVLGRLLLCLSGAALLCGLWWAIDHRNPRADLVE